jgi:Fic family protein
MKEFNYKQYETISLPQDIVNSLTRINKYKGRQEMFLKQKPDVLERLVEIAKIQSTDSSNRIEGIWTTDKRLKELVENKTQPKNRKEQEIVGYRNALNTIHTSHEGIPFSPNIILQLHRDLYRELDISYGGK